MAKSIVVQGRSPFFPFSPRKRGAGDFAFQTRQVEPLLLGASDGVLIACVGVSHHAARGIVPQHALDAARGGFGAVANDDHAGVLRIAHADAAAVMQRNPGAARGAVEQRVEQRPIGDGVGAVLHRLRLTIGRGDRARIEMIAADDDRRLQFAALNHLVEREAQAMAIAEAHPTDARRQPLEMDPCPRHIEPIVQVGIVGNKLLDLGVGGKNILRVARQGRPAERADAAAEQRTDIGGHEAGEIERVAHPLFERHLADVVAVVDGGDAGMAISEHRAHVLRHRFFRGARDCPSGRWRAAPPIAAASSPWADSR